MSSSQPKKALHVRSNLAFRKLGLEQKIHYQICLSTSRNPDFVSRHPNELVGKNSDWKKEIIKRVTHEEGLRFQILDIRLAKRTGERRV